MPMSNRSMANSVTCASTERSSVYVGGGKRVDGTLAAGVQLGATAQCPGLSAPSSRSNRTATDVRKTTIEGGTTTGGRSLLVSYIVNPDHLAIRRDGLIAGVVRQIQNRHFATERLALCHCLIRWVSGQWRPDGAGAVGLEHVGAHANEFVAILDKYGCRAAVGLRHVIDDGKIVVDLDLAEVDRRHWFARDGVRPLEFGSTDRVQFCLQGFERFFCIPRIRNTHTAQHREHDG